MKIKIEPCRCSSTKFHMTIPNENCRVRTLTLRCAYCGRRKRIDFPANIVFARCHR